MANNSSSTLDKYSGDVQVRPCKCYPGHFDPIGIYFDMPDLESFLANQPDIAGSSATDKVDH